jgi:hypothetical protein
MSREREQQNPEHEFILGMELSKPRTWCMCLCMGRGGDRDAGRWELVIRSIAKR